MKIVINLTLFLSLLLPAKNNAQNTKQEIEKSKNYSVEVIRYTIPQEQSINFEKAYQDAGQFLKSSKYCLGYQLIHGNDEPNHYIIIIHWTSKEDHLSNFRKSPEFSSFFNLLKPFYTNIEEMKHYDLTNVSWSK